MKLYRTTNDRADRSVLRDLGIPYVGYEGHEFITEQGYAALPWSHGADRRYIPDSLGSGKGEYLEQVDSDDYDLPRMPDNPNNCCYWLDLPDEEDPDRNRILRKLLGVAYTTEPQSGEEEGGKEYLYVLPAELNQFWHENEERFGIIADGEFYEFHGQDYEPDCGLPDDPHENESPQEEEEEEEEEEEAPAWDATHWKFAVPADVIESCRHKLSAHGVVDYDIYPDTSDDRRKLIVIPVAEAQKLGSPPRLIVPGKPMSAEELYDLDPYR